MLYLPICVKVSGIGLKEILGLGRASETYCVSSLASIVTIPPEVTAMIRCHCR